MLDGFCAATLNLSLNPTKDLNLVTEVATPDTFLLNQALVDFGSVLGITVLKDDHQSLIYQHGITPQPQRTYPS